MINNEYVEQRTYYNIIIIIIHETIKILCLNKQTIVKRVVFGINKTYHIILRQYT